MTDGNKLVENLIAYAKDKLYLNSVDESYLRLRLYKFFLLKTDDIKKYAGSGEVLDTEKLCAVLEEYLSKNFFIEGDMKDVLAEVFAQLTPMPSQIDRNFKNLRERMGADEAVKYFYNISTANAFVRAENYHSVIETEGCYSKVYISDKKRGGLYHLDTDIALQDNARIINYEIGDKTYAFGYLKYNDEREHAALALPVGKSSVIDKTMLDDATSFVEYMPVFTLVSSVCGKTPDNIATLDKFFLYRGDHPVFSAKDTSFLRSEAYPDADISIYDYPVSAIKFVTFNRNTVIELLNDIISGFNTYMDEEAGVFGNVKHNANRTFFAMRILGDGRFCVNVFFTKADDFDLYSKKKDLDRLFSTRYFPTALLGRFVIDIEAERSIGFAKKYLLKRGKLNAEDNCPEFLKFLENAEEDQLFTLIEKKANVTINDVVVRKCDEFLRSVSAFDMRESTLALKKFLATVNIK